MNTIFFHWPMLISDVFFDNRFPLGLTVLTIEANNGIRVVSEGTGAEPNRLTVSDVAEVLKALERMGYQLKQKTE